uniref:Uncharacterized protein n=1 Tax=Anguilla anguilla TaxID=7936 RepID=A0A0E9R012_ANGAN
MQSIYHLNLLRFAASSITSPVQLFCLMRDYLLD